MLGADFYETDAERASLLAQGSRRKFQNKVQNEKLIALCDFGSYLGLR